MSWNWRPPRRTPWQTPLPLPRDTADAVLAEGGGENFGLLCERYLAYGEDRGRLALLRELADRRALVPDFKDLRALIEAHDHRWRQRAAALGAVTFTARPEWRAIVGLGTNALLGTGITLHPVYGFPVVSASALKGICRLYAERVLERPAKELDHALGWCEEQEGRRGDLIFLDSMPVVPPRLERDIINPLFGDYYRGATPPAGYLSAQPTFFLTLGQDSLYRFGVASFERNTEAAEQGAQWLRDALDALGVGAKTCAGYGYWRVDGPPPGEEKFSEH